MNSFWTLLLCLTAASAYAQNGEAGLLFGGTFGGSFKLQNQARPNFQSSIADSFSAGASIGYRFDAEDCIGCNLVAFRWMIQDTHLSLQQTSAPPPGFGSFRPSVALNSLLADFTHEFPLEQNRTFTPFLTGTAGAVLLSAPASTSGRFAFGLGGGVKIYPSQHYGLQFQTNWQAIVLNAGLQQLVCGGGGCIVVLNGGITSQFQVSIGPLFRF
jgi:hypothetical protein